MQKIKVRDIVNPARLQSPPDACYLPADANIYELSTESVPADAELICAVDENGTCVGNVCAERVRTVFQILEATPLIPLLDEIQDAIIAIDKDGVAFYVNPNYMQSLNVAAGQILGKNVHEIERDSALIKALHTGEVQDSEKKTIPTVERYASVHAFPLIVQNKIVGAASIIRDVTEVRNLHQELERAARIEEEYRKQVETQAILKSNNIIGESRVFTNSVMKANAVAATDVTVLLRGENGAGKEVFVHFLQQNSRRKDKPFITMNCAAVPASLIESELFGYEEGSFTGAKKGGKMGKFQLAEGGTLFLDEIGDMPLSMQAKLLRVLQEGEIEKIGRQQSVAVDVRVIAATNQPLEQMVQEGRFRQDLFYRLNVVPIDIPPLRERGHDVILLAAHFLEEYNKKYEKNVSMEEAAYQRLLKYNWPGNVRELQNVVESCVVLCGSGVIRTADLPDYLVGEQIPEPELPCAVGMELPERLDEALAVCEREVFLAAIKKSQGNRQKAIDILGVTRRTFYRKVKELQIPLN